MMGRALMDLSRRIANYAYRHWMRAGMTAWPTVRQTAKALRVTHADVEEASGTGDFCTQCYNCSPPQPFGEHEVCSMTPAVDDAWRQYYGVH